MKNLVIVLALLGSYAVAQEPARLVEEVTVIGRMPEKYEIEAVDLPEDFTLEYIPEQYELSAEEGAE